MGEVGKGSCDGGFVFGGVGFVVGVGFEEGVG